VGGEGAEALSPETITPPAGRIYKEASSASIEGLSDRHFREVAELFLANPSILPANGIQLVYAGQRFFPYHHFINSGAVGVEWDSRLMSVMIEIGNNIMTGVDYGAFAGGTHEQFMLLFSNQTEAWAMLVRALWPAAWRLVVLHEGPPEFTPTIQRLVDVRPGFGPSRRYAEFLKDATDLDATAGVDAANEIMSPYFQPVERSFPRIRRSEGPPTSVF